MPNFEYTAKDSAGATQTGIIVAKAQNEVARILLAQKLYLIKVKPAAEEAMLKSAMKPQELIEFTIQFQMLFEAGLPITRALEVLEDDAQEEFRAVIRDIRLRVLGGASFGDAITAHEKVFPDVYIGMLKGGEMAGTFDVALRESVRFLETREGMKKALREATVYPVTVLTVSIGVIILLTTMVFPKILGMLSGMNVPLSIPTRIVMGLSYVMRTFGPYVLAIAVLSVIAWVVVRRKPEGRIKLDGYLLKIPFFGDIIVRVELSRFSKAAGSMIASGVDLLRVINIAGAAIQNRAVFDELQRARQRIEGGLHLSEALDESPFMPKLFMTLLKVGEATGSLVLTFDRTGQIYERDVQTRIKKAAAIFQPAVLIFLAAIVTTTALALFMTIQTVMRQATTGGAP